MITVAEYYMGRDVQFSNELTAELRANAEETVKRTNALIAALESDGVDVLVNPVTKSQLTSGWRPKIVNQTTFGAALHSNHTTCQASDIFDPHGDIDNWCMNNQTKLADLGLWLEHPSSTKGWSHVQIVAPRSGHRVFYP
jgi:hypothetical protein